MWMLQLGWGFSTGDVSGPQSAALLIIAMCNEILIALVAKAHAASLSHQHEEPQRVRIDIKDSDADVRCCNLVEFPRSRESSRRLLRLYRLFSGALVCPIILLEDLKRSSSRQQADGGRSIGRRFPSRSTVVAMAIADRLEQEMTANNSTCTRLEYRSFVFPKHPRKVRQIVVHHIE